MINFDDITNENKQTVIRQPDIDKIYLYAKDLKEAKYQFLINKREDVGSKHYNDPEAFIEYSNNKQDVHRNIEEYNPGKKRKLLIVLDGMIADMISNEKPNAMVTELFIGGKKN